MAASGSASQRRERSKRLAASMRAAGVCRTTGRCGVCYAIITIDSWKSRYTHVCRGR